MLNIDNGKARRQRAAKRKLAAILQSKRDYSIEGLESRLYLSQGLPPAIVVGRTLSSYTTGGVLNSQETITYTVYNEQADSETGVLLTDTLQPGITVASASQQPDQSGQNLAWSLGTIQGFDRASVTLTINLPSTIPTQLDTGAQAYATLDAGSVSNSTPAATLRTGSVDPTLLDATPDTDATDMSDAQTGPIADPYIQEEAAKLDYNAQNIFNFLQNDIGYNSYLGSVRGARGTLWSDAGNSLDVASLGVALMRASGIPAQYVSGTLSESQAQQLILSMFPATYQTVGYIPAGTQTADPADDPQLLNETESHYWFQFDTGSGMQDADPLMPGATIGQTFTTSVGAFTEVPDNLRETTEISLTAEIYSQADASLDVVSPFADTVVLDQTFNDVNLVGRPLTVGNFVNQAGIGVVFTSVTNTYTPYVQLGDEAYPDLSQDLTITGTPYQEVLTNFPLGSQILTGLFLNVTLSGPNGSPQTSELTVFDRIGYSARQGGAAVSVAVSPASLPALTGFDKFTINVMAGLQNPGAVALQEQFVQQADAAVQASPASSDDSNLVENLLTETTRLVGETFLVTSDQSNTLLAESAGVDEYDVRPRVIITSSRLTQDPTAPLTFSVDLRIDSVRSIPDPGQSAAAETAFNTSRGLADSVIESSLFPQPGSAQNSGASTIGVSAAIVFAAAATQGIGIVMINTANLSSLAGLAISAIAKARITTAVMGGQEVIVPQQSVELDGEPTVSWYEMNPNTGEMVGVNEDGSHGFEYSSVYVRVVVGILLAGVGLSVTPFAVGLLGGLFLDLLYKISSFGKNLSISNPIVQTYKGFYKGIEKIVASFPPQLQWVKQTFNLSFQGVVLPIIKDPPLPPQLLGIGLQSFASGPNATTTIAVSDQISVGSASGSVLTPALGVSGLLDASWTTSGESAFAMTLLNAANATVQDPGGNTIGAGSVAVDDPTSPSAVASGGATIAVSGSGNLSFYGPADPELGVSGDWQAYSASASGNVVITLTTDALTLNGQTLPAGTYTITTSSATLSGSGPTSSPNFSGSASITTTNGTINLDPGTGGLTVGGHPLDPTNGAMLDGYTGSIGVAAGGGNNLDTVTLNGNAANVLTVSATPATLTTDQNTPITFQANVNTSFDDTYNLTADAPPGWAVTMGANGNVAVTPAAGLQSGIYPIQVVAQSTTDANLVAQTTVNVTITPTSPGLALAVNPDSIFTVPFNGAQLPTAFQATMQNLGPAADSYNLTFANVPSGFTLLNSGTSVTVPAGETGILGLYLQPDTGQPLPAPGTVLTFDVTATSTSDSAITQTQVVTFTVPDIDAVTLTPNLPSVDAIPGQATTDTVTVTNVGNVDENNIVLTSAASTDLGVSGLTPLSLAVGQSANETVTLTPDSSTPLNSALDATLTATFGASGSTQTLDIPVNAVVPGAPAIANAATVAEDVGDSDLANRLNDLATELTNLVLDPTNAAYDSQALASLNSVIAMDLGDPFVAPVIPSLEADATSLAQVTDTASASAAAMQIGGDVGTLANTLNDEFEHGLKLSLPTNVLVAQPQTPEVFPILLGNTGAATTTYAVSVAGVPSGVTAVLSQSSVTLDSGQTTGSGSVPELTLTLTSTSTTQFLPFSFTVTAVAQGAPEITYTVTGALNGRTPVIQVPLVTANPTFTSAGGQVDIKAQIFDIVDQTEPVQVSYVVTDPNGKVLFTSQPTAASLDISNTIVLVDLGTLDTTGFAAGEDTITVSVADSSGNPISGATGIGSLLIGTPVSATLSTAQNQLYAPGGPVNATLQVTSQSSLLTPLSAAGQTAIAGASGVAIDGTTSYVGASGGIDVVNIADPTNPTVLSTFGASDLAGGTVVQAQVYNSELVVLVSPPGANGTPNGPAFFLLIYSLANPTSPTLVGQTPMTFQGGNPQVLSGFTISNNHVYTTADWYRYSLVFNNIFGQFGESLDVDISNPASPTVVNAIYNDPPSPSTVYPDNTTGYSDGTSPFYQIAAANNDTLLIGSSTATMADVTGSDVHGLVMVVDTTNPSSPSVLENLQIPGMAVVTGISVQGSTAFVIGSSQNLQPGLAGLGGDVVVAMLNLSNPQSPTVISTQTLNVPSVGIGSLQSLGNGQYVTTYNTNTHNQGSAPKLLLFDTSDSQDITATPMSVPNALTGLFASGGKLYTTDNSDLTIYNVNSPFDIPAIAEVTIPAADSVDPTTFSLAPSSTTMNADGTETLQWNLGLSQSEPDQTITFTEDVTGLPVGGSIPVISGNVAFVSAGTPGMLTLPAQYVSASPTLYAQLSGPIGRAQIGEPAVYSLYLFQETQGSVTYSLTVQGIDPSWVNLQPTLTLSGQLSSDDLPLTITSSPSAPDGINYAFTVTVTGSNGTVAILPGELSFTYGLYNPPSDSQGILVGITPAQADAGPGTNAVYTVQLTNAGSGDDTFLLSDALPAGVNGTFSQTSVDVPPGASNFRDLTLTLSPQAAAAVGGNSFTVTATSMTVASTTSSATGTINVSSSGVTVSLDPSSTAPGNSFELTVTNTGQNTDTFDLALAGPAALVSTLDENQVTLDPGDSQMVEIDTAAVNFAVTGSLELDATATSENDPQVQASAKADLTIPASTGMTSTITPDSQTLAAPGPATFIINVTNTGNQQDQYEAFILSATGPITASLTGLDGQPTQSIPLFILPGLSSGELELQADLTAAGQGSVVIAIISLSDNSIIAIDTASLNTTSVSQTPVANDDSYTTNESSTLTVPAAGVLANDTDPNNLPLTASLVSGPSHGVLTLDANGDGGFVYVPDPGYVGSDLFVYTATDSNNLSANATVNLTVTAVAPTAVDDTYSTNENTTLTIPAAGVLSNDSDVAGESLTATLVTGPAHGVLTLDANGDGGFTYVPDAGYAGSDSFVYQATGTNGLSANATVNLTVITVAPTAVNDSYNANEDTTLTIAAAAGVLANDSAPAGESLVASLVSGTSHGMLTLDANGDGGFTYVPDAGYVGSDSFMYKATDTNGLSTDATVTLKVGAVPMVVSTQVGDGSAQRSTVSSITVVFSEPVNFSAASFTLDETQNENSGFSWTNVSSGVTFSNPSGDGMTWVISVIHGGSLDRTHAGKKGFFSDGIYQLTLNGSAITDAATGLAQLNGGNTQIASFKNGGGVTKNAFSVLFGDMAGTGAPINNADYSDIKAAYGRTLRQTGYNAALDFDGNGIINAIDYGKFKVNYGKNYAFS